MQWQAPAITVTRTATRARQSNSVDLDKARLVVSVGRGIGSKENISLAEALCQTIGAELACSPGGGKREVDGARALRRYLQPDAQA